MSDQKQQKTALALIRDAKGEFLKVIPKHMDRDRLFRISESAIRRNEKLGQCTGISLLRAIMEASALGLEIGLLGECWLIPYKDQATLQIGYQGLIKLAIQSRSVLSINAGAVRNGDSFDYAKGSNPFVKHKPALDLNPDERPFAYYCALKLAGGGMQIEVMGATEVESIHQRSPARNRSDSPWNTSGMDYASMGIKTVIKRALKYVPKSPELGRALELDNRNELAISDTSDLFPDLPQEQSGEATGDIAADALAMLEGSQPKKDKEE